MKVSLVLMSLLSSTVAFAPSLTASSSNKCLIQRNMFSGAGAAAPKEDDSDSKAAMEKMAKAMGMTLAEYQLGINARMRMEEDINNLRVTAGDASKGVTVERCGNSPPKHLVINITEKGKAMGKAALENELVIALKSASEQSKKGREKAQQKMMQFIGEQMKSM